jgi:hypothetical protein
MNRPVEQYEATNDPTIKKVGACLPATKKSLTFLTRLLITIPNTIYTNIEKTIPTKYAFMIYLPFLIALAHLRPLGSQLIIFLKIFANPKIGQYTYTDEEDS